MELIKFYNIIDKELESIIEINKDLPEIKKHKLKKQNERKGYATLLWFLDFYGQKTLDKTLITDGDDDGSCDIIFSNKNNQGETFFYIIQSKWLGERKAKSSLGINKDEFGKTLTDFSAILQGTKKKGANEKFNRKYEELKVHLENNGKVKFIYFTLAIYNKDITDGVEAFRENYKPNIELETITLERIRRDYIEFKYKEIKTNNPLEYKYNAEDNIIELEIERFQNNHRDIFEFHGRTISYIFLLKPKTIFKLFDKFKFSLFYKNVRNPLHSSNYNKNIVNTLNKKPDAFWYFNNGVTAITELIPKIGQHAKKITIEGLQIINGAQTIYSVYQAYLNASDKDRKKMDTDARIMLRLIRSSDEDLNTEITKFTNLQNPLYNRDFFSNDDIQIKLQNASFETNYWYEKRRGEFRQNDEINKYNIQIATNELVALTYVSFFKQDPVNSIMNSDNFFVSKKEDAKGLYEYIFNDTTKYEDMLASLLMWELIVKLFGQQKDDDSIAKPVLDFFMPSLALSKIVLKKYLLKRFNHKKELNLTGYIIKQFKENNKDEINLFLKSVIYSIKKIQRKLDTNDKIKSQEKFRKLMTNIVFYETIKSELEEASFEIQDIDNINLDNINLEIPDEIINEVKKNKINTLHVNIQHSLLF